MNGEQSMKQHITAAPPPPRRGRNRNPTGAMGRGRAFMPTTSPTGGSFLPGRLTRAQTRTVIAATVGAVLEWYDLLVYAMFAVVLAKQFFPATDPSVSLLLSLGTFALAWLVRPLGAVGVG